MGRQLSFIHGLPTTVKRCIRVTMVISASMLHRFGIFLIASARRLVRLTAPHANDQSSDNFVVKLPALHKRIRGELKRQRKEYGDYAYFYGYPYQSLAVVQVFGERGTEERFESYELDKYIKKDDRVLDIGCNCGFVAIYSAYRTGCSAEGVDINPHMIRVGQHCADYLKLSDRVTLIARSFLEHQPERPYSVVLSFATHWTDDKNYRVRLQDHLLRIHAMMMPKGILLFESHSADVGNKEFYSALEEMRAYYSWDGFRTMARGTRELYVMRRTAPSV